MVKHSKTIHRQKLANCLSVFDHFVELAFKGLRFEMNTTIHLDLFSKKTNVPEFSVK